MDQHLHTHGQWWTTPEEYVGLSLDAVTALGLASLQAAGASDESADFLLTSILDKALQGDFIRGLWLLPDLVHAAQQGREALDPKIVVRNETTSAALVDGGTKANGGVVCRHAMELAITKARMAGAAWISVRGWHWNLGPLMKMATSEDMIAIGFNASIPTVAPLGGATALLGNAPVGFGIPAGQHDPVIIDLCLTNTSSTPVARAALSDREPLPEGFILDAAGSPTTDARDYMPEGWDGSGGRDYAVRGSLVPLGGELSGHKGYALVFAINALATLLSGTRAPWEQNGASSDEPFGCQFAVVDPAVLVPLDAFKARVDGMIETLRRARSGPDADDILYPGERSQQLQREARRRGIVSVPRSHYHALDALARELSLDHRSLTAS